MAHIRLAACRLLIATAPPVVCFFQPEPRREFCRQARRPGRVEAGGDRQSRFLNLIRRITNKETDMIGYASRRVYRRRPSSPMPPGQKWSRFICCVQRETAEALQRGRGRLSQLKPRLIGWIADHRNLRHACDHLATDGGPGAGPNGVAFHEIDSRASWSLVRSLSKIILDDRYRHGEVRTVRVPKSSGRGHRILSIANIQDRVVSRAIAQIMEPLLGAQFDQYSFCRPGRGVFDALATANAYWQRQCRKVWIVNDVANAFDAVPLKRLMEIIKQRVPCQRVAALIAASMGIDREKGILQGSPLSQLLMNVYLDHFLDRPWRRQHPDTPLLRYMDDLLVLCGPKDDAERLFADLSRITQNAGLALKFDAATAIRDIGKGETADWLGFRIFNGASGIEPRLKLGDGPGDLPARLRSNLLEQHDHAESPLGAVCVIEGMIAQMGPTYLYDDIQFVYSVFRSVASELAFEEIPSREQFQDLWGRSYTRWANCQEKAIRNLNDELSRDDVLNL